MVRSQIKGLHIYLPPTRVTGSSQDASNQQGFPPPASSSTSRRNSLSCCKRSIHFAAADGFRPCASYIRLRFRSAPTTLLKTELPLQARNKISKNGHAHQPAAPGHHTQPTRVPSYEQGRRSRTAVGCGHHSKIKPGGRVVHSQRPPCWLTRYVGSLSCRLRHVFHQLSGPEWYSVPIPPPPQGCDPIADQSQDI